MIAAIAFALQTAVKAPTFVEIADPDASGVLVEVLVPITDGFGQPLGAKDRDDFVVLLTAMTMRSADVSRNELAHITQGRPIRVESTPLGLRLSFSSPDAGDAVRSLASAFANPLFDEDDLKSAAERLSARTAEGWEIVADPFRHHYRAVPVEAAKTLWRRAIHPERLVVGVSGAVKPGDSVDIWKRRVGAWSGERPIEGYFDISAPESVAQTFVATKFGPPPGLDAWKRPETGAATALAAFALGVGKESTVYRVVREKLGLAYRVEWGLVPSMKGWLGRFAMASTQTYDPDAVMNEVAADVDAWDGATKARALAMAESAWTRSAPEDAFLPAGRGDSTPGGRLFNDLVWTRLTGARFDTSAWLTAMRSVEVGAMRDAAKRALGR